MNIRESLLGLKGLIVTSLICFLGPVLGGCLVSYGPECNIAFKFRPNSEESTIAVGFHKLAVRISIGLGLIGTMLGWITLLGSMASDGMDLGALAMGEPFR